jgi:hypothetical protein
MDKIAESILVGTATAIVFSSIPLRRMYLVEFTIKNVSGAPYLRLFVNGDLTESNYRTEQLIAEGAVVSAAVGNQSVFTGAGEEQIVGGCGWIHLDANNRVRWRSNALRANESIGPDIYDSSGMTRSPIVGAITALRFEPSVASQMAAGTRITLWGGS